MNSQRELFKYILERKWQTVETLKSFHVFPYLSRQLPSSYKTNKNIDSSLFLTTLPAKKREKKPRVKIDRVPTGPLLLLCKNRKLNHYSGMTYGKFEEVPLASKGWYHKKSKDDYFTIMPAFEHSAFTSSKAAELPKTFQELEISDKVIEALDKVGVYNPTVIQAKAISKFLTGTNITITAETGCGKTLAYVIPMLENILKLKNSEAWEVNAPFGIILLPTKELAAQVGNVVSKLGGSLGLHCVTLISGDFENIVKAPSIEITDVIVTTLGILIRYMESKIYSTTKCKHLILDEADMFFEANFLPDLRRFLSMAKLNFIGLRNSVVWPNAAQICLTSATSDPNIFNELKNIISMDRLEIVSTGYLHKILFHIRQHFMRLNKSDRPSALLKIIKNNVNKRIPTIVFSNHLDTCDYVHYFLSEQGIESAKINGRMFSDDRLKALIDFKEGKIFVVSCTDCMSRGLDLPWVRLRPLPFLFEIAKPRREDCDLDFFQVKQIVNFEFPNSISSYIHRCGRTGRLGYDENCSVINFVSGRNEIRFVNEIEMAARTGRELTLKLSRNIIEKPVQKKRRRKRKVR